MKIDFKLSIDTTSGSFEIINMETGELKEVSIPKKRSVSSKKTANNDNPNPQITLEDNKYILNQAAVDLMGVQYQDKLEIKLEKQGSQMIPIIGTNTAFGIKAGNKLTKSFTVSYRGKNNEELRNYGTIFDLEAHPSKEGIFIMKGNEAPQNVIDDNVNIEETSDSEEDKINDSDEELVDFDLSDFVDGTEDTEDMSSLDFKL